MPEFGDIYVCRFPFTSGTFSKPRPVWFPSFAVSPQFPIPAPPDIELRSWAAGLEKPSVARLNRVVTAEKSLLTKYLGKLAASDAAVVKAAWNEHMAL